ncbi:MAG: GNAT family N-acetyltransferase [Candidatus Dojkabacteria bacterium]|jgi:N-acetylglutamate synthase-like GNAT family acetyltransferase
MNEIVIRDAREEDINTVFELGKNISGFEVSEEIISFWPIQLLRNSVGKEDVVFLIIEKEGNLIGFIIVNLNYSLSKGEVEDIFIIEPERNKGYGTMLLQKSIEITRNRGVIYKIEYVNALTNTAEGFFEKNGFIRGNVFTWFSLPLTDIFKRASRENL